MSTIPKVKSEADYNKGRSNIEIKKEEKDIDDESVENSVQEADPRVKQENKDKRIIIEETASEEDSDDESSEEEDDEANESQFKTPIAVNKLSRNKRLRDTDEESEDLPRMKPNGERLLDPTTRPRAYPTRASPAKHDMSAAMPQEKRVKQTPVDENGEVIQRSMEAKRQLVFADEPVHVNADTDIVAGNTVTDVAGNTHAVEAVPQWGIEIDLSLKAIISFKEVNGKHILCIDRKPDSM